MKINKCVKIFSEKLDKETFDSIDILFQKYGKCKNDFYSKYSGIKSLFLVNSPKKLRDKVRKENKEHPLEEKYGFQSRHWTMALFDISSNIESMWTNLSKKLKTVIRENSDISSEEKNYLYYILSVKELWSQVLLHEELYIKHMDTYNKLKSNVSAERIHYLHNYLRRITRKFKPKIPHSDICNCIQLDQEMYTIIEEEENTYIVFAADKKFKRFKVKLRSTYCYRKNGNIQLVLNRNKRCIEIHKLIKARVRDKAGSKTVGADKGYSTLLSVSDGREYGIGIGDKFSSFSDFTNRRNTNRNYFIQKHKELRLQLERIQQQINESKSNTEKAVLSIKRAEIIKEMVHIEKHNLGNKLYDRQQKRFIASLEKETNYSIKKMFVESDVAELVKEDLSFTRNKKKGSKKRYTSRTERLLNTWLKGTLNERLEYIASEYSIKTTDVNPAYTSQYCNTCNSKIERTGKHHETAICPVCGKMNANINAAKNILARKYDSRITLYTPYLKVKEIIEAG